MNFEYDFYVRNSAERERRKQAKAVKVKCIVCGELHNPKDADNHEHNLWELCEDTEVEPLIEN